MRIFLFILSMFFLQVSYADGITVGFKNAPPFAELNGNRVEGYSIDFIKDILKTQYPSESITFVEFRSVDTLLRAVQDGKVNMGISALTITADRERYVDFSHSYFTTSPAIAIKKQKYTLWQSILDIGSNLVLAIIGIIALFYTVGKIMDVVDGDINVKNAHEGAWWAIVTFSTVGYGDFVPSTGRGRLIAAAWIIASLFLVSIFTAHISSIMTIQKMEANPTELADLASKRVKVATVANTTSQSMLLDLNIQHVVVDSIDEAVKMLESRKVDALVYDHAILSNLVGEDIAVWPIEDMVERYGIAFPDRANHKELKEKVNVGILQRQDSREDKLLYMKYFKG